MAFKKRPKSKRHKVEIEWKIHAINLGTEKHILVGRDKANKFVYKVDKSTFYSFDQAVLHSEDFGNAYLNPILIQAR